MDIKELREKSVSELRKILGEKREAARKLRFDLVTKQVKNTKDLFKERKFIARILTLIKEKNNG